MPKIQMLITLRKPIGIILRDYPDELPRPESCTMVFADRIRELTGTTVKIHTFAVVAEGKTKPAAVTFSIDQDDILTIQPYGGTTFEQIQTDDDEE